MGCGFSNTGSATISDPRSANFSTNVSAFGYGRAAERVSLQLLSDFESKDASFARTS
jgi:hypothetical protein